MSLPVIPGVQWIVIIKKIQTESKSVSRYYYKSWPPILENICIVYECSVFADLPDVKVHHCGCFIVYFVCCCGHDDCCHVSFFLVMLQYFRNCIYRYNNILVRKLLAFCFFIFHSAGSNTLSTAVQFYAILGTCMNALPGNKSFVDFYAILGTCMSNELVMDSVTKFITTPRESTQNKVTRAVTKGLPM